MRKHHITVRAGRKLVRACSWAKVLVVREQLQQYQVRWITLHPAGDVPRLACWSPLAKIVEHQANLARAEGTLWERHRGTTRVIVCPDATLMWRAAVTRVDVHVACHGDLSMATRPGSWSTWVTMDGGDKISNIRQADLLCGLSRQALSLQGCCIVPDAGGNVCGCTIFLTGDGKVMGTANAAPGLKCWLCDQRDTEWLATLQPCDTLPRRARDITLRVHDKDCMVMCMGSGSQEN